MKICAKYESVFFFFLSIFCNFTIYYKFLLIENSELNPIDSIRLVAVPIAIYVFTLPLPYIGVASSLPAGFVAGAIILIIGLLIYAWTPSNSSSTASIP